MTNPSIVNERTLAEFQRLYDQAQARVDEWKDATVRYYDLMAEVARLTDGDARYKDFPRNKLHARSKVPKDSASDTEGMVDVIHRNGADLLNEISQKQRQVNRAQKEEKPCLSPEESVVFLQKFIGQVDKSMADMVAISAIFKAFIEKKEKESFENEKIKNRQIRQLKLQERKKFMETIKAIFYFVYQFLGINRLAISNESLKLPSKVSYPQGVIIKSVVGVALGILVLSSDYAQRHFVDGFIWNLASV